MAKLKQVRSGKKRRQAELAEKVEQLRDRKRDLDTKIHAKREKRGDAKTDERADELADEIDVLRGQVKRLEARIEELRKVRVRLGRQIRRLTHRIQAKVARNRYYASEHFRYDEFDCHDGRKVPKEAYEALRAWCRDVGEPARLRYGAVYVLSGYRPADYNERIGGAENSVHIYDYPGRMGHAVAVDWAAEKGGPRDWFDFTQGRADGRGFYPTSGFHHADNRNRIGWPDAAWSG